VSDEGTELGFKTSGMWFAGSYSEEDKILTVEKAAEYLWKRFTEHLR